MSETPTTCSVTIEMSTATVDGLMNQGNALIGFAAVQGTDDEALPLVWCLESSLANNTLVQWQPVYGAYASSTPIASGTIVEVGTSQPMAMGQTFTVSAGPTSTVSDGGTPGTITILNVSTSPFTCGIGQTVGGATSPVPFCAYPLDGGNTQILTPLNQIVLLFTSAPLAIGEAWSGSAATSFEDRSGTPLSTSRHCSGSIWPPPRRRWPSP